LNLCFFLAWGIAAIRLIAEHEQSRLVGLPQQLLWESPLCRPACRQKCNQQETMIPAPIQFG